MSQAGFDGWLEERCRPYYAERKGRPPGVYSRMILVGYFEGIGSQRGIAWRCADSPSLRNFLGVALTERAPEHSSMTRVHQRLPQTVHEEVFFFVLKIAAERPAGRHAGEGGSTGSQRRDEEHRPP